MKKKLFSTIALATLCCGLSYGQATIGSETPPRTGALLDLQEHTDGTSNKGLGLPRVKLLETRIPNGKSLAQTIDGTASDANWDKDEHIGLVIYNTNTDPSGCKMNEALTDSTYRNTPIVGFYVWTGKIWERIPGIKEAEDVRTIVDHGIVGPVGTFTMSYTDEDNNTENETYYYASFGDAGIWMTQNLRTRYCSDGIKIEMNAHQDMNYLNILNPVPRCGAYPNQHGGDATDPTLYNKNVAADKQIGLLYDWYTATEGQNCSHWDQKQVGFLDDNPLVIGEYEVERKEADGYIKGICPKGWHIPSDREWNMLEKEITTSASKYAIPGTPNKTWTKAWEHRSDQYRLGSSASVMLSTTLAEDAPNSSMLGKKSKPANEGGFDVILAGGSGQSGLGGDQAHHYGKGADFWSSSNARLSTWMREFHVSFSGLARWEVYNTEAFSSVRCKKNEK